MPSDCAEHPTFPGGRMLCPGALLLLVHPRERGTNLPLPRRLWFGDKRSRLNKSKRRGLRSCFGFRCSVLAAGQRVTHSLVGLTSLGGKDLHPQPSGSPSLGTALPLS